MQATIVQDAYTFSERKSISQALSELTSPGNGNWSSAGTYSFWDYDTKEILYIGLAIDLTERFEQHNGLRTAKPNNSKKRDIAEYFETHEKLGYSVILQSALSQPVTRNLKGRHKVFFQSPGSERFDVGEDGRHSIRRSEGMLIETFKKIFGAFPKWNKVGGSVEGQLVSAPVNYPLLKFLNTREPNVYVSRASLRELVQNSLFNSYEGYLHSLRISIFPPAQAIKSMSEMLGYNYYETIKASRYFDKRINI